MRPAFTAPLALGLLCVGSVRIPAQRAAPIAVTSHGRGAHARPLRQALRIERERPRAHIVAPVAVLSGIAGGIAGYYAAERSCADHRNECWDHFAYVPIGYTAGVGLGGGIAGIAERCNTGLLRATGGALLGFVAGVASAFVLDGLGVVTLAVAPVVGATWLVTSCRIQPRDAPTRDG